MRILNTAQMREADRVTIEDIGLPALVLMENAGRQVVSAIEGAYAEQLTGRVAILCGRGNNGGDGFVVARTLSQRGVDTTVFVIGSLSGVKGEARANLEILGRLNVTVIEVVDEQSWELHASEVSECSLIVDAIIGTGLTSGVSGVVETIIADVNASGIPIVAIDLPSGLSGDTPDLVGESIDAVMTVALGAPKLPLVLPPAEARAGQIVVADIGIPLGVIEGVDGPRVELLTPAIVRSLIEPRVADAHKGDFGRVTIVAGSRGKTGAAHLAGQGALRSGAGLVTIATPASCVPVVASMAAEVMTEPLDETPGGVLTAASIDTVLGMKHDVVVCGPGLGRTPETAAFVRALLERSTVPLVLDADALWVMGDDPALIRGSDERVVVITPHAGEMARLTGQTTDQVQASRMKVAVEFAQGHGVYVVLKGHRTLIATPSGDVGINPTGNPGMATGGTGDVLAGMLAAWLAQLLDAESACRLAVFLHGAAGDLAESTIGQAALLAGDVVDHIGDAVVGLTRTSETGASEE